MKKTRYYCDRCKEETGTISRMSVRSIWWLWHGFDICEKCYKEFEKWVENKQSLGEGE